MQGAGRPAVVLGGGVQRPATFAFDEPAERAEHLAGGRGGGLGRCLRCRVGRLAAGLPDVLVGAPDGILSGYPEPAPVQLGQDAGRVGRVAHRAAGSGPVPLAGRSVLVPAGSQLGQGQARGELAAAEPDGLLPRPVTDAAVGEADGVAGELARVARAVPLSDQDARPASLSANCSQPSEPASAARTRARRTWRSPPSRACALTCGSAPSTR